MRSRHFVFSFNKPSRRTHNEHNVYLYIIHVYTYSIYVHRRVVLSIRTHRAQVIITVHAAVTYIIISCIPSRLARVILKEMMRSAVCFWFFFLFTMGVTD